MNNKSTEMHDTIKTAVELMRANPNSSPKEILQILQQNGMMSATASQLVALLPIAYGRVLLADSGVTFSETYLALGGDGQTKSEKRLDSLPLWCQAMLFAKQEVASGIHGTAMSNVAGRSSEINAINKALHDGKKLRGLLCSPPVFLWPDIYSSESVSIAGTKERRRGWHLFKK